MIDGKERENKDDDVKRFADAVVKRNGWILNPDHAHTQLVLSGLSRNREKHGYYLCPCRESGGDRAKDRDIICPCDYANADIDEYGHCFCGVFVRVDWHSREDGFVDPIPERRPLELHN